MIACLLPFVALLLQGATVTPPAADEAAVVAEDLAAARALFERNLQAIRDRDREAYLDCYLRSPNLVRVGPEGPERGFDGLAASLGDDWPDRLAARDLRLEWLAPGLVFGTYRYHVVFDGVAAHGLSERLFRETPDGWRIAVTTAHPAPPGTPPPALALSGATVLDGEGGVVEDALVVVEDGVIASVGPRAGASVPEDATLVDLSGRFLVPGLVDTHVHYGQSGWADGRPDSFDVRDAWPYAETVAALRTHPERLHRALLACGITSALDCGGYAWSRRLAADSLDDPEAPRVRAAGPLLATFVPDILSLPAEHQFVPMLDEDGVRAAVASHAAQGGDAIKVWIVLVDRTLEEVAPLVHAAGAAAREHGLPLLVHATDLEAARVAVAAGADLLVHSVDDAPVDDAFVEACLASGVAYCPTLVVVDGYLRLRDRRVPAGFLERLDEVSPWVAERLAARPLEESEDLADPYAARRATMAANLVRLAEAGVPVVLGTDAGNPLTLHGPSVRDELQAMVDAGLAPERVIRAATADAARAAGFPDAGRLRPGARADALVLDEDPRLDVTRLGRPRLVLRGGVLHRREDLLGTP